MSNRELEERAERQQTEAVARALGISVEDLEEQDWSIDEDVGNDGAVHGYVVTFADGRFEHLPIWALNGSEPR
ncbi:MAG: hypothetical protein JO276_04245 [Sphingomonadaceae bacterium]|nr:hypothetical protein [Sphingomonadaceae bacterium]